MVSSNIVFLYKTNEFEGKLISSEEGEMYWIERQDLSKYNLVEDFLELLKIFDDDKLSEFQYVIDKQTNTWKIKIQ